MGLFSKTKATPKKEYYIQPGIMNYIIVRDQDYNYYHIYEGDTVLFTMLDLSVVVGRVVNIYSHLEMTDDGLTSKRMMAIDASKVHDSNIIYIALEDVDDFKIVRRHDAIKTEEADK